MENSYINLRDSLLECYPRLFVHENDVLHELFFVIGTGFYWENGCLTDGMVRQDRVNKARVSMRRVAEAFNRPDFLKYSIDDFKREEIERRALAAKTNITGSYCISSDGQLLTRLYPISSYSKIVNLPKDIMPDWLDAAKKAFIWATSDNVLRTEEDDKWLAKIKKNLENWHSDTTCRKSYKYLKRYEYSILTFAELLRMNVTGAADNLDYEEMEDLAGLLRQRILDWMPSPSVAMFDYDNAVKNLIEKCLVEYNNFIEKNKSNLR